MRGHARTYCMPPQALSAAPSGSQGHTVLRIFRTFPAWNMSLVRRVSSSVDQLPYLPFDVRRFHYRSTHKKCSGARSFQSADIIGRLYPAFRYNGSIKVGVLGEDFFRCREVQLKCGQISIVYPIEVWSEISQILELVGAVRFQQDLESKPISFENHTIEPNIGQFPTEDFRNQYYRTGSRSPSGLELPQ